MSSRSGGAWRVWGNAEMFVPSLPSLGPRIDQAMREDLATSLERLSHRAAAVLPMSFDTADLRRHRVDPGVFARYYDLVFALQGGRFDEAGRLWQEIADRARKAVELACVAFDSASLGEDAARFQRLFALGAATAPRFLPPNAAALVHFQKTVPSALALLEAVHPAWAEEVRGLTTRIVAVVTPATPDAVALSGGSSLMVWGAILINVAAFPDRIGTLSVIAHEATHQFLFGLSRAELLVTNPVEDKFCTELRPIPRSMNAMFHSTYVSGRIHALFQILADRGDLSPAERQYVADVSALQSRRFDQGSELILRHGQLTPLGRRLIEEARDVLATTRPR